MGTLHITPGYSAAGSLKEAIRLAGLDEQVLAFPDELCHGPLLPDTPATRAAWWDRLGFEGREEEFAAFWPRILAADERLVVWFARHSASELAFFLAWADRLGDRPYRIVDTTALQTAVALVPPGVLTTLLGTEREIAAAEVADARHVWQRLKAENAPIRIVTPTGLASAPEEHFDPVLLEGATSDWRKTVLVVVDAMMKEHEPYYQVGDLLLRRRLAALVEAGRLEADGDPWLLHESRVRLGRLNPSRDAGGP